MRLIRCREQTLVRWCGATRAAELIAAGQRLGGTRVEVSVGPGDLVELAAKPIARALKIDCLDAQGSLKPDSGCAQRRNALNKLTA